MDDGAINIVGCNEKNSDRTGARMPGHEMDSLGNCGTRDSHRAVGKVDVGRQGRDVAQQATVGKDERVFVELRCFCEK